MLPGDSGGDDDGPWWGGQHGTGNGNSFIENAYGVMRDGLISGLGTLGSIAMSAVRGPISIPNKISMSYKDDPEGHIVSTPLYTPGARLMATAGASLDVLGSVPMNAQTGGLFAQATGVKSSAATVVKEAINANSKLSTLENILYRLETVEGEYLKTGITSKAIPEKRYTATFMKDKIMRILDKGSRSNMLKKERSIVESTPGPLNKEPWAGKFPTFF
ncbi:hypothetical protein HQ865_11505 [Mucilaginibacter mali]|uniref:Uncharacterized protein n=1 Tax=Mucilaginibacter mali TaxID=2740462 RepID=A0A7D4TXG2_9SPHI|nr:hypothetical protein [Mucilaginibacter mali]QKJ30357.1 hypothetical protein HQ865_11505 [Mucilaginibacter mali]